MNLPSREEREAWAKVLRSVGSANRTDADDFACRAYASPAEVERGRIYAEKCIDLARSCDAAVAFLRSDTLDLLAEAIRAADAAIPKYREGHLSPCHCATCEDDNAYRAARAKLED